MPTSKSTPIPRVCAHCGVEFFQKYQSERARKYCSQACFGQSQRGEAHSLWKGDAASDVNKHRRAQRLIPVLASCEECGAPATHRHHKDGNPGNNDLSNLAQLCCRCHLKVHGQLAKLAELAAERSRQIKLCQICGRIWKPLTKGRCRRCRGYWDRNGVERPPDTKRGQSGGRVNPRPGPCVVCGRVNKRPRNGRCPRCSNYWYRTGADRKSCGSP